MKMKPYTRKDILREIDRAELKAVRLCAQGRWIESLRMFNQAKIARKMLRGNEI